MAGQAGRPVAKSKEQLKREGGYREDRHADRIDLRQENFKSLNKEPPQHMGNYAKDCWRYQVENLPEESLTTLDHFSLMIFCDMYEVYCKSRQILKNDALDSKARQAMMSAAQAMDKIGKQFGWTPQSRAGIPQVEKDDDDDAFSSLIASMKGGKLEE